jgi:hypothetical protein
MQMDYFYYPWTREPCHEKSRSLVQRAPGPAARCSRIERRLEPAKNFLYGRDRYRQGVYAL